VFSPDQMPSEIESMIEPDRVADDFGWKPVTFVGIHPEIIDYGQLSSQYQYAG
jgi:hypothetical protein